MTTLMLCIAVVAMLALHVAQRELDPVAEPVSFYAHGHHGRLLPLSLGAFGIATLGLAHRRADLPRNARAATAAFGIGMLITAVLPSDLWFPWEAKPTISGFIHATVAMIAPVPLLHPMWIDTQREPARRAIAFGYLAALIGCGASLGFGYIRDGPPPLIGLAERVLALFAVVWVAVAQEPRSLRSASDPRNDLSPRNGRS